MIEIPIQSDMDNNKISYYENSYSDHFDCSLNCRGLPLLEDTKGNEASLAFQEWKAQYGVNWSEDEEQYRKIIFEKNYILMKKHNADQTQTYKMAINQFNIYTDREFVEYFLTPMKRDLEKEVENIEVLQPNGDIDWTTKGMVSPIKNQGQCGSCWAFSATGVLESMALQKGQTVSLSEQQLVDCSGSYGNQGCNGGWPSSALKYVKDNGLSTQSEYAYTAKTGKCLKQGGSFKISSVNSASTCSGITNGIQARPLSVTVDASNWSRYGSGVFSNCATSINHAVLLVGVVGGNWKIKNSWGTGWGEQGFIRLAPGNTCGVCNYPAVYGL